MASIGPAVTWLLHYSSWIVQQLTAELVAQKTSLVVAVLAMIGVLVLFSEREVD
jgi:hypothetical protein